MAAYDDIFDFERLDCVGYYRCDVWVSRMDDVGDVAVSEDVAGTGAGDCCFGNARVGATDEENAGFLACRVLIE